jgi:hypothetical protein
MQSGRRGNLHNSTKSQLRKLAADYFIVLRMRQSPRRRHRLRQLPGPCLAHPKSRAVNGSSLRNGCGNVIIRQLEERSRRASRKLERGASRFEYHTADLLLSHNSRDCGTNAPCFQVLQCRGTPMAGRYSMPWPDRCRHALSAGF